MPQSDLCPRCGSTGFGCYECTPADASDRIHELEEMVNGLEAQNADLRREITFLKIHFDKASEHVLSMKASRDFEREKLAQERANADRLAKSCRRIRVYVRADTFARLIEYALAAHAKLREGEG